MPIPGEATYVRTCDSLEEAERYRDAAFASIPPLINDSIFETLAAKYTTPKGRDWAPEVEKFLSAKGPIPTPDPPPRVEAVDSLPAALPAPDPAPPPPPTPPREEPTPPTILELTSNVTAKTEQEQDDAQDRILLGPDENAMTKQEMLDLHEGYGFDSGKFYIDEEGILFYVRQRYSKDGAECFSDETYLCRGNLRVTGEIKRTDGAGHHFSREVEFKNRWGESTKVKIADNLTASAVLRILAANGLDTTSVERDRPRIAEFLKGWKVRRHVIAVNRRWYNGCCYVTGKGAIGPAPAGKELVLADTFHDEQTYCGTLEGWQKTIGAASVGNRILIDCLSVAFSAFVLEPLNAECMGYMLYCPSSMGKGSTVAAACSVAGTKLSDCIDTPYNIETHATRNSDTLIVFDELDATKNLAEFSRNIYILGNGRGKGRFTKEKSTWRVPWMVTGETSMSKVRADAKMKPRRAGNGSPNRDFRRRGQGLRNLRLYSRSPGSERICRRAKAWSVQNQGVAAEAF